MGCVVTKPDEGADAKYSKQENGGKVDTAGGGDTKKKTAGGDDKSAGGEPLQGRQKFIEDVGATVMTVGERSAIASLFLLSCPRSGHHGLLLSYLNPKSDKLFGLEISDEELGKQKVEQRINLPWSALFKSLTSDTLKNKTKVNESGDVVTAEFSIVSARDKSTKLPFRLTLKKTLLTNESRHKFILEPMTRMVQKRRQVTEERERETKTSRLQTFLQLQEFSIALHKATIDRLKPSMGSLREESARNAKVSAELTAQIGRAERKMKMLRRGPNVRNDIDGIYEEGGARTYPGHIPQSDTHIPQPQTQLATSATAEFLCNVMPEHGDDLIALPTKAPSDERIQSLYKACTQTEIDGILQCMTKLDDWDFNVFDLDKATNNNALFITSYAILCKLNLINILKIDDAMMRNFLIQVQSGYHPNPYHNATHAADVTQINYFILIKGGLAEKCKLSKEETFASIVAGAVHDFDHPGFNNGFHSRTNSYLSTLYNDRSVLENHHLACTYEMMKHPKYNILGHMTDEQKKEIRDTMTETVLATDMGLHGKIFSQFRRRVGESPEWSGSNDDKRLALSMSIKTADTSNCGRPNHLYLEWAKGIANEFYHQGDVEAEMCLPISPYMDRRKEKEEFPQGQVFFINVVVMNMFEKMAEFLPPLDIAVRYCCENKEYWHARQS